MDFVFLVFKIFSTTFGLKIYKSLIQTLFEINTFECVHFTHLHLSFLAEVQISEICIVKIRLAFDKNLTNFQRNDKKTKITESD